ncbi:MAG: DNA adenine methylase [Pseudomonadota bacterium]
MTAPRRPVLRWHGGKWVLAPWIISHFPEHRIYVEPFGGAASVLLRKERCDAEVYNDLDGSVVDLFRVLQNTDQADRLMELLRITPFARAEFTRAFEPTECPVEQARRLIIRSFMGFGSDGAHNQTTGFRANSNRSGSTPAHDWANYPDALDRVVKRMRGVIVESRPAAQVMTAHDGFDVLHYVDPPYVHETRDVTTGSNRAPRHQYAHELTLEDHEALLLTLKGLDGMVVLSGYPHPLYDDLLPDWKRVEKEALADGARKRTEVLWINPACADALEREVLPMFAGVTG